MINLKNDDEVAAAFVAPDGAQALVIASDGQTLRFETDTVQAQGRGAAGVAGMKIKPGAHVVAGGIAVENGAVVTVSDAGRAKVTRVDEFPVKGRGGGGLRAMKLPGAATVVAARVSGGDRLWGVFASADDPSKADPTPRGLEFGATKRDGAGSLVSPVLLAVGEGRW